MERSRAERLYERAELPKRFWDVNISDYDPASGDMVALGDVESYIDSDGWERGGLILAGGPGRGKTMLATMIAKAALERGVREVVFVSTPHYVDLCLRDIRLQKYLAGKEQVDPSLMIGSGADEAEYLDGLFRESMHIDRTLQLLPTDRVKLLVLDDLGAEHTSTSEYGSRRLESLVRDRIHHSLATILTTNLSHAGREERYGLAFASAMLDVGPVVTFPDAQDHRGRERRGRR